MVHPDVLKYNYTIWFILSNTSFMLFFVKILAWTVMLVIGLMMALLPKHVARCKSKNNINDVLDEINRIV
jgi:hypothetical protein